MECDFLGAWRKALESVEALGTARNVFVHLGDQVKDEDSDDEEYDPSQIYRRKPKKGKKHNHRRGN